MFLPGSPQSSSQHTYHVTSYYLPTKPPLLLSLAINALRIHLIDKTLALNPCLSFCHHSILSYLFLNFLKADFSDMLVLWISSLPTPFFSPLLSKWSTANWHQFSKSKYALQIQLCDPLLKNTPGNLPTSVLQSLSQIFWWFFFFFWLVGWFLPVLRYNWHAARVQDNDLTYIHQFYCEVMIISSVEHPLLHIGAKLKKGNVFFLQWELLGFTPLAAFIYHIQQC